MQIRKQVQGYTRILNGKKVEHPTYIRFFEVPDINLKKINLYGKGIICRFCGATSEFIIKRGTRKVLRDKNKQRYHCYWCGRRFSKGGLLRMRNNFKTITKALKLLEEGYSSRDVQKQLNNVVSHTTITRWRKKWTKIKNQKRNMK